MSAMGTPPGTVLAIVCTHGNLVGSHDGAAVAVPYVMDSEGVAVPPDYIEFVTPHFVRAVDLSNPPSAVDIPDGAGSATLAREPRDDSDGRGQWRYVQLPATEQGT